MTSRDKTVLSTRLEPQEIKKLDARLKGSGISRSQFTKIAMSMILKNADMYEEIDFPLREKRQVYVGDKLIMEIGGAVEPGQFLYGLSYLKEERGEK